MCAVLEMVLQNLCRQRRTQFAISWAYIPDDFSTANDFRCREAGDLCWQHQIDFQLCARL